MYVSGEGGEGQRVIRGYGIELRPLHLPEILSHLGYWRPVGFLDYNFRFVVAFRLHVNLDTSIHIGISISIVPVSDTCMYICVCTYA